MQYTITLSDEARLNLKEASDYYLKISATINDGFSSDLIKTIDQLKENPHHHEVRYRGIRIAHAKTYPFGVHFIVENNSIRILKIVHHKQFYKIGLY